MEIIMSSIAPVVTFTFPVAAQDMHTVDDAPFQVGDVLTYVRARRAGDAQFVIARVDGLIGVYRGLPSQAQIVGRVTGVWSPA